VTATKVLFGGDISLLSGDHIIEAFNTDQNRFIQLDRSSVIGHGLDKIASITNAAKSKCKFFLDVTQPPSLTRIFFLKFLADAQKKMKAGGFYLNNIRVTDTRKIIQETDLIDGKVCILRVGKSSYYLIQVV
jgi:tyrosyl-tRNA synthetase